HPTIERKDGQGRKARHHRPQPFPSPPRQQSTATLPEPATTANDRNDRRGSPLRTAPTAKPRKAAKPDTIDRNPPRVRHDSHRPQRRGRPLRTASTAKTRKAANADSGPS